MMKMTFPKALYCARATTTLALLLLLLSAANIFSASAFAVHNHFARPCVVRFNNAMTAAGMVSTLADDWNIAGDSNEESTFSTSSLLRQHQKLQLTPAQSKSKRTAASNTAVVHREIVLMPELELPRHTAVLQQQTTAMESVETMMGRLSMVAAFVLVANELVTGQSLPDQIYSVATMLMSN